MTLPEDDLESTCDRFVEGLATASDHAVYARDFAKGIKDRTVRRAVSVLFTSGYLAGTKTIQHGAIMGNQTNINSGGGDVTTGDNTHIGSDGGDTKVIGDISVGNHEQATSSDKNNSKAWITFAGAVLAAIIGVAGLVAKGCI